MATDLTNTVLECDLSIISNPFDKACVEQVIMVAKKRLFGDGTMIYATISFRNGNTTGEQQIDADNLNDLLIKVQSFIKSL